MSAALHGAPTMDVDFNAPEIIANPWPVLKQIREAGPVVWNERGHWMTGHDWICRDVLNQPAAFGQEGSMKFFFGAEAFISIDEKLRHDALRGIWMTAFTRKALEELTRVIRRFCDELLDKAEDELSAKGSVELGDVFCRPLPTLVIAHMMGVSEDMLSTVIEWSDLMGNAAAGGFPIDYDNDPHWLAAEKAKHELAGYLYEQIKYRRAHPGGTDLISQIVHSEVGKTLSEEAIMVNTRQLLFAGNETTARWLGHILVILGRNPALRRELVEQPALMPQALNEFMRWEPIVHTLPRGVMQDGIEVAGVPLPKGSELVMMLGGANRDPARYDDPERLNIHRERKANLGFGFGLHSCLGVTLSQLEAQQAVSALLARFPDFTIREPIVYSMLPLRGPTEVHVSIG